MAQHQEVCILRRPEKMTSAVAAVNRMLNLWLAHQGGHTGDAAHIFPCPRHRYTQFTFVIVQLREREKEAETDDGNHRLAEQAVCSLREQTKWQKVQLKKSVAQRCRPVSRRRTSTSSFSFKRHTLLALHISVSQSVVKVQEQSPEGRATFYFLPW